MSESHFFHRDELIDILNDIVGKTFGEVDKNNVFSKTVGKPKITGIAGNVIEQSVLGYPADQAQRPDLDVDGVLTELKTTGMRLKRDGNRKYFEAKEPASITAVSIPTIAAENFYDSAFWHKIAHLLFVFYHYESSKAVLAAEYARFHIEGYRFYEFSEDDLIIIQRDWQIIHDFIADIQARCTPEEAKKEYPNLSTLINKQITYLDTAPKYPNAPRFRFRKRVISAIIQETFNEAHFEKLPGRYLGASDIERKCIDVTRMFYGWSMADILAHFGVGVDRSERLELKHYAEQAVVAMFGGTAKKISQIEIFRKMGYIGKTITVTAHGARTEDMKLFSADLFELSELYTEEDGILREKCFEDSELYQYFHDNKLLCIMFQETSPDEKGKVRLDQNRFIGFKVIDLSDDSLIAEARRTWEAARTLILKGELRFVPSLYKNGEQRYAPKTGVAMGAPNLPKARDYVVFFRGTGSDATDKVNINGIDMLRQDYWIRGTYLVDKLKNISVLGQESH